jgi:uncharacterized protein (TIGR02265 family)
VSVAYDISMRPASPLHGTLDLEAIIAAIPASYTVKGMFVTRFADLLGSDYSRVEPLLRQAPRGGRFVPFKDYSQADYTRIVAAAALKLWPELPLPEAVRRAARDDLATFAGSLFGKVVLGWIGDAHATLLHVPEAYSRVAPGPRVSAEDLDARTTRILFQRHRGIVEYMLGQLEGIVLSFGQAPLVTVRRLATDTLAFDVVHVDR